MSRIVIVILIYNRHKPVDFKVNCNLTKSVNYDLSCLKLSFRMKS
jgi:hypothetical protein